jgi:integrase
LKPGDRAIVEHGIRAERLASGDARYSVNVMVDGQRIHRVVGNERDGVTREQAERLIEKLRTEAREGRLSLPKGRKIHRSFAEVAEAYLKRLEEAGGKNLVQKTRHVRFSLIPHLGALRIDQVSTLKVEQFVQARLATGRKQATVNRELATLSHMMRRAVRWGWVRAGDIPEIVKAPEARKRIVILSEADCGALMAAAEVDDNPDLALFVAFGLNTAMRHSEILRTRLAQVDFEARRVFIPQAKAGEREQPITKGLADTLKQLRPVDAGYDYLFPSRSKTSKEPYRLSMAKAFRRAVIRAGLKPAEVTPHVMRHTAITRLVKAGIDLPTIQRISGHKTLAMVLRYAHIHGAHIDAAIAILDRAAVTATTPKLHTPDGGASDAEWLIQISV